MAKTLPVQHTPVKRWPVDLPNRHRSSSSTLACCEGHVANSVETETKDASSPWPEHLSRSGLVGANICDYIDCERERLYG